MRKCKRDPQRKNEEEACFIESEYLGVCVCVCVWVYLEREKERERERERKSESDFTVVEQNETQ